MKIPRSSLRFLFFLARPSTRKHCVAKRSFSATYIYLFILYFVFPSTKPRLLFPVHICFHSSRTHPSPPHSVHRFALTLTHQQALLNTLHSFVRRAALSSMIYSFSSLYIFLFHSGEYLKLRVTQTHTRTCGRCLFSLPKTNTAGSSPLSLPLLACS